MIKKYVIFIGLIVEEARYVTILGKLKFVILVDEIYNRNFGL